MLFSLIDVLTRPEEYVCAWRDGELYIEPVAVISGTDTESTQEPSEEAELPMAA